MSYPKIGMPYSEVKNRCKRIMKSDKGDPQAKANLVNSLMRQCRLAEGEKAINELGKELVSTYPNRSHALSGAGNKQTGWGNGKKLGDGTWRCVDGKWSRID